MADEGDQSEALWKNWKPAGPPRRQSRDRAETWRPVEPHRQRSRDRAERTSAPHGSVGRAVNNERFQQTQEYMHMARASSKPGTSRGNAPRQAPVLMPRPKTPPPFAQRSPRAQRASTGSARAAGTHFGKRGHPPSPANLTALAREALKARGGDQLSMVYVIGGLGRGRTQMRMLRYVRTRPPQL